MAVEVGVKDHSKSKSKCHQWTILILVSNIELYKRTRGHTVLKTRPGHFLS